MKRRTKICMYWVQISWTYIFENIYDGVTLCALSVFVSFNFAARFSKIPKAWWLRKIPFGKATPWKRYRGTPSESILCACNKLRNKFFNRFRKELFFRTFYKDVYLWFNHAYKSTQLSLEKLLFNREHRSRGSRNMFDVINFFFEND